MPLLAGAEPYEHDGSDVGVVLCHGFTSSPASMRPWGEHLAAAGYTVSIPRLPGHGTRWRDMAVTRWTDWYGECERALDATLQRCSTVAVGGLSMGGTLTLRLAEQRGDDLAGIMLVNPAVRVDSRYESLVPALSHVVPALHGIGGDIKKPGVAEKSYDWTPLRAVAQMRTLAALTRADLFRVRVPVLLFHSSVDHVVHPENSQIVLAGITSADVTERLLTDSYHVATLDNDAPRIFAESARWLASVRDRHAAASVPT